MQPMWSQTQARVSHRLAMHFRGEPHRLPGDRAIVSFTFDDVPKSAATSGARLLDSFNANGTYYVAGGLLDRPSPEYGEMVDADDIRALHGNGHEIGCHTFSHSRTCDLGTDAMTEEIERNRDYLQSLDRSISIENFAYPYGLASIQRKRQLQGAFRSCRGIVPKVNSGTVDLQFLHSMPLIHLHIDAPGIERALDEAVAKKGWLIFYTHDVAPSPTDYGCTPAMLKHALDAAQRRGVTTLSIAEALQCLGA